MKKTITTLTVLTALTICSCNRGVQGSQAPLFSLPDFNFAMEEPAPQQSKNAAFQANRQQAGKIETIDRKIIKQGEIKFQTADVNKTKSEPCKQKLNLLKDE